MNECRILCDQTLIIRKGKAGCWAGLDLIFYRVQFANGPDSFAFIAQILYRFYTQGGSKIGTFI